MITKKSLANALLAMLVLVPGVSLAQAQSQSTLTILTELKQLQAELQQLESSQGTATWCYTFNTNLSAGMSGPAVTALQTALQKDGEPTQSLGTFDDQTAAAVTGFQEKYSNVILAPFGLTNGTGYAGKATRAELNMLFGCGASVNLAGPATTVPPVSPQTLSAYSNSQYGISFTYPSNYVVKSGSGGLSGGDYGFYPEDSQATSLVTLEVPSGFYPNTDFVGAYLNVSVDTSLSSSECYGLISPNIVPGDPRKGTKTIDGVTFNWINGGGAAAGTGNDLGHAAGYSNGTCYEFNAGAEYADDAPSSMSWSPFNDSALSSALNSVIATMKLSSSAQTASTPPIACPAWGCSSPPIKVVTGTVPSIIQNITPDSVSLDSQEQITIIGTGFTPTKNQVVFIRDTTSTGLSFPVPVGARPTTSGQAIFYQNILFGGNFPSNGTSITFNYNVELPSVFGYDGAGWNAISSAFAPGDYTIYVENGNGQVSSGESFVVRSN